MLIFTRLYSQGTHTAVITKKNVMIPVDLSMVLIKAIWMAVTLHPPEPSPLNQDAPVTSLKEFLEPALLL